MGQQKKITKDHYDFLFALFQTQTLIETLDGIEMSSDFVREFKQKTNIYKKFLEKKIMTILDQQYNIDAEHFEVLDKCIAANAKEFAEKGFESFFEIID